jgi:hypothetical protein
MNATLKFLTHILFITLAACSTQEVKENSDTKAVQLKTNSVTSKNEADNLVGQNPPMTIMKGSKKLNLVRIMDGGICKNEFQGVKGVFLLYADPHDIERIKREKGAAIFSSFQTKIQAISGDALQMAIKEMNLSENPFALGEDEAQQKLAQDLIHNLHSTSKSYIAAFQKETSLTIDITAFPPSLVFYQKGCDEATINPNTSS